MQDRVRWPAIGIIVSSVLAMLSQLGLLVIAALGGSGQFSDSGKAASDDIAAGIMIASLAMAGMAIHAVTLWGAVRMMQRRSWGLSLAAAVLAMLPCSAGCLSGVPVGIWAIVVLLDEEIRNSFT